MIALFFSLAGFFWAKALYAFYVKNEKKTAIPSFALASSLTIFAYIASKAKGDRKESKQYEGVEPYHGIIIDPNLVKKTCYCEPVCRKMCFARGAIGALSEEQVEKYCKHKGVIQKPLLGQSHSNK